MRKIFASMTAVSMAAAVMLAGCGSNSSDKKTTTAASTKATEAATEKKTEKETEKATEKASEEVSSEEASSEASSKEDAAKVDENAKVRVIDINLTSEEYAFGVDKEQPELLEKTNEFIAKIMEDGTFDEICNHYFGDGDGKVCRI
mgnify:CR=1 FL=1